MKKKIIFIKNQLTSVGISLACISQAALAHDDGIAHSHATPILISCAILLVLYVSRVGLKKIRNRGRD